MLLYTYINHNGDGGWRRLKIT